MGLDPSWSGLVFYSLSLGFLSHTEMEAILIRGVHVRFN